MPLTGSSKYWTVKVNAVRVGGSNYNSDNTPAGWRLTSSVAYLETATSLLYVPKSFFPTLIVQILGGNYYTVSEGFYWSTCDLSKYQMLFIAMGQYYFVI